MIVIGLTGSIAMGKSETARMFAAEGVPVFESDREVHRLYEAGGLAVAAVGQRFPQSVVNGAIDRTELARTVLGDDCAMTELEAIVHPLIRSAQENFLVRCRAEGRLLAVLDIPLLFETGRDRDVDIVVVVSAPAEVQRERALQRSGMTEEKLTAILARQTPDAEKRAKADYVVDSSRGLEFAHDRVRAIVQELRKKADPHA